LKTAIRAGSLYAPLAHKQYRSLSRRKKGALSLFDSSPAPVEDAYFLAAFLLRLDLSEAPALKRAFFEAGV
jgi:hypothetical protein